MNQIHVSKELGAAITSARLAHGMKSVQQLAEKIGLSQNTMWRIEKGNVRTSEENLNKLKEILNIEWRKKPTGKEASRLGEPARQKWRFCRNAEKNKWLKTSIRLAYSKKVKADC